MMGETRLHMSGLVDGIDTLNLEFMSRKYWDVKVANLGKLQHLSMGLSRFSLQD